MKFSIVIPAYNEEQYLPRLLDSIEIAKSNYSGGASEMQLLQNKMMFARIKYQAAAILVVAILLAVSKS